MIREAILSIQASKGLLIVSYFFAGIGTIFIEEGFYSYLGADLNEVKFNDADDLFASKHFKIKIRAL